MKKFRDKTIRFDRRMPLVVMMGLTVTTASSSLVAQSGGGADLSWNCVSSGGQSYSGGGGVLLGNTLAQVADEPMSGGGVTLVSGFWAAASGDCNTNGFDDQTDLDGGTSLDCNTNGFPDECEASSWIGPDGGSYDDSANWQALDRLLGGGDPTGVPASDAILRNSTGVDNRCILSADGVRRACRLTIGATGSGKQILEIDEGANLEAITGTDLEPGGELHLVNGRISGQTIVNAANTIRGYGYVDADLDNAGLVEGLFAETLHLWGASLDNQPTGEISAPFGSRLDVRATSVTQSGELDIRAVAAVNFVQPLVNEPGATIRLAGGALDADGLTNSGGALLTGFGIMDTDILNNGQFVVIADTQIVGNLQNEGTVIIQSGLFTVTGDVTGSGSIIGGFGGRDGGSGLALYGDLDWSALNPDAAAMAGLTIQMVGDDSGRVSSLEVFSADRGPAPAAVGAMLARLHIGPHLAGVRLADNHDNARSRRAAEVLYVRELVIEAGSVLDVAGKRLYCERLVLPEAAGAGASPSIIDSVGGGGVVEMRRAPRRAR